MKEIAIMDGRGRVTIGKKLGKRFGRRFYVVPANNEIILMPAPKIKDPIAGFAELGRKAGINKYSMKQLKKIIEEEAEKEALSNLHH